MNLTQEKQLRIEQFQYFDVVCFVQELTELSVSFLPNGTPKFRVRPLKTGKTLTIDAHSFQFIGADPADVPLNSKAVDCNNLANILSSW